MVIKDKDNSREEISELEVKNSIRNLIRWAGDDPDRAELLKTPDRVMKFYKEFFSGYKEDPFLLINQAFYEVDDCEEMIVLRDICFESYCEHHMLPIIGKISVAYIPSRKIVGISKIARLVNIYTRRLQIQERLTTQIANAVNSLLDAKGAGVIVEATHHCMSYRGVKKSEAIMRTSCMLGVFREDQSIKQEFINSHR